MIRVRVPATTANLGPGFDCLGMALHLYNYVSISTADKAGPEISISGPAATAGIPTDSSNLVFKAVKKIFDLAGKPSDRVKLDLELHSPLARGLGSSASAITGGMVAANEILGRPLSQGELALEVSRMEGHPDNVIPCLVGGLTSSIMLQDKVLFQQITPAENLRYVVFIPDYELETSTARGVMPKDVSMKDAVFNASRIPHVLAALSSGRLDNLREIMDDRLHQPYRIPLIKGYNEVSDAALAAGASAVCISGAGPTILAVTDNMSCDAVAVAGSSALQNLGVVVDAKILCADNEGCKIVG